MFLSCEVTLKKVDIIIFFHVLCQGIMDVVCSCGNILSFLITWSLMLELQQALIATCITDIRRPTLHTLSHQVFETDKWSMSEVCMSSRNRYINVMILFTFYYKKAAKVGPYTLPVSSSVKVGIPALHRDYLAMHVLI